MAPTLPITVFQLNPDLQVAFDTRTRTPVYALERLQLLPLGCDNKKKNNSNTKINTPNRRPNFHEDVTLPESHRSRNSHYKNSGYDRGHMAPAADFIHHDPTTFVLTNAGYRYSYISWLNDEGNQSGPVMTKVMAGIPS